MRGPKEILYCFQIVYIFPTYESQGKWKWSVWAMHLHLQGNEREILLQRYWNYYVSSQNAFYEPRVKIKSPEKPQNWKTPAGILGHVAHGRNFSCFILTPIINNMYIIQMQKIMGFQKHISVPIAIIPKEILFVKISRYGDVFGGI